MSARDRLKAAFNEGRIWGEPADLDELINETVAEEQSGESAAPVVRVEAGELRHVEVRPGDLFVLTSPHDLSEEQAHQLRERWRTCVGEGVPLVIVEGGELSVFRPAPEEAQR